ncbi:hypothetical protein B296_00046103 [Ensete ventricosum]|uniref:Uncharacterized protein n=1 Tax=Ensete ventricosum TaxID=4639 RepID=A0A426YT88_ENSVE|nr:hypothetical protein B296_00046103 [Ensete ventricosum]
MVRYHGESSKMGQAGPLLQAAQVGCKCKLARKLLEPLMRSATVNKTSVKLGILHEGRRRHLERQLGRRATERDLQWRKPALIFLKRAWRNSNKAKEGYLG